MTKILVIYYAIQSVSKNAPTAPDAGIKCDNFWKEASSYFQKLICSLHKTQFSLKFIQEAVITANHLTDSTMSEE